jgi:uncharacterized protein with HEPN domain
MVDAAQALASFVEGRTAQDLERDRMLLFAVVRAIEIMGEAASRLSGDAQAQISDIPWASIVGMRHRLIHGYFDVNTEIVWKTATVEVPALLEILTRAVSAAD